MQYLALGSALVAALFVYAFVGTLAHPEPVLHPKRVLPARSCIQLVASPRMMACSDKRVYIVTDHWTDIGPVTPVPGVPYR